MLTPLERVNNLLADLRIAPVDFDAIYRGKNKLSPLESVELFLLEEQRIRIQKQNDLRRKRAALPAEKTLDSFDFGFQRSVSKEQMLRLSGWNRHLISASLARRALGKLIWRSPWQCEGWILDMR